MADAERELTAAREGRLIDSLGDVKLFDDRLEAPDGTADLGPEVRASVEASGAKTEKSDSRETFLLLETPRFDSAIRVNPNQTGRAREFSARINTSAKNADGLREEHGQRLQQAQSEHERASGDHAAIEAAEARLVEAEADRSEVVRVEQALARAEAATEPVDEARNRVHALDPSARLQSVAPRNRRFRNWWARRSKMAKVGMVVFVALVALIILGAALGDNGKKKATHPTTPGTTSATPQIAPVSLAVASAPNGRAVVQKPQVMLKGFVTPGARVTLGGQVVPVTANRFRIPLRVKLGANTVTVRAAKDGFRPVKLVVTITRRKPPLVLRLTQPGSVDTVVRAPSVTVAGFVSPGSRVTVRGRQAVVSGSRFTVDVPLNQGSNSFFVRADKAGFAARGVQLVITRELSAAEIAAKREQARQAFIASTTTIPYNQLIKSPDRYAGTKVRYYGQILQVQEDPTGGGFILLYVTDAGYDIWTDQVWVDYQGHIRSAEGDKITVYGVVVGSKSYQTQIGGETFVPEINAKYISE